MRKIKIRISSIIIPLLIIILLFSLTIFLIIMPYIKKSFIDKETDNIKFLVESQIQVLDTLNHSVLNGGITPEHAKAEALSILEDQRYGPNKDFYFWVMDLSPVLLMHPFNKDLENKYVGDYVDAKGNRLFQEMVDIVKAEGEGYLEYLWEVPYTGGTVLTKKSFVKLYEPWGWIVGTGFYIHKLSLEIRSLFIVITLFSVVVLLLIILISVYLYRQRVKLSLQNYNFKINLFESERRYYELLNSMNDGFIIIDEDNKIKLANRKFCGWIGVSEKDVLETNIGDYIDEAYMNAFNKNISLRKSGINDQYEIVLDNKLGSRVNVIVSPKGIFDPEKKYFGSYAVLTDISLLKNIQNKLEGSLNQKEILIKELHHRVKNNLQIIISLLNFQKGGDISDDCEKHISRFESRLFSMALVHELMYETANFQTISLRDYIYRLTAYIQTESSLPAHRFKISAELADVSVMIETATTVGLICTSIHLKMLELFERFDGRIFTVSVKSRLSLKNDSFTIEFRYKHDGRIIELEEREDDVEIVLLENLAVQLRSEFFYGKESDYVVSYAIDIPLSEPGNPV